MIRAIQLAVACAAVLVAMVGQLKAGVIITYQDIGSDLRFDYSGSLSVDSLGGQTYFGTFATASSQVLSPVFYSSGDSSEHRFVGDSNVTHTPGPFATNLPPYSQVHGTTTGTAFLFRLIQFNPERALYIQIWGDWGAANSPINGQLILPGQSAASLGMIDGWQAVTEWGSITFQAADTPSDVIPEPSSLAIFGIGACVVGIGAARRRRRDKQRFAAA